MKMKMYSILNRAHSKDTRDIAIISRRNQKEDNSKKLVKCENPERWSNRRSTMYFCVFSIVNRSIPDGKRVKSKHKTASFKRERVLQSRCDELSRWRISGRRAGDDGAMAHGAADCALQNMFCFQGGTEFGSVPRADDRLESEFAAIIGKI